MLPFQIILIFLVTYVVGIIILEKEKKDENKH